MFRKSLAQLAVILACLCFAGNSFAQKRRINPPETITSLPKIRKSEVVSTAKLSPEQERRAQTFQVVWQTIKDNYFDRTFNNLDWDAVKKEYEPRVAASQTDAQLHLLLQEMIDRLNRSHFTIIPPEVYREIARAREKAKSEKVEKKNADAHSADEKNDAADAADDLDAKFGIGIDVRIFDNRVVITRIEKNSAAEKSGLKIGYVIEKVNDVSLRDFLEKIQRFGAYSKAVQKQLPLEIIAWFINGEKDTFANLSYLDEKDQSKEVRIRREKLDGESVKILQNLPEQFFRFETYSLDDEIGYIKFNFFALSAVEKFCAAISQFKDKKAIVIDMRGNLGGSFAVLLSLSGLLTDKNLRLGTAIYKVGAENLLIRPHPKNYSGKIVILTDGLSYSAAEIFAAALQENNRAIVIGDKSAGAALPATTRILPTGAVFLFPVANFQTPNGNLLEGKGVEPNLAISLDRESLLAGNDKQLDAAINFLKGNLSKNDNESLKPNSFLTKPATPPPPAPKAKLPKTLATVIVPLPSPPPKTVIKKGQDAAALKVFADFVAAVGGEAALKNLSSYTAGGTAKITKAGAIIEGNVEIYRQAPNKFTEKLIVDGFGEVREVFDGKNYFVDTKVLGTEKYADAALISDKGLFADFYEILKVKELYPNISFLGKFDSGGRKLNLIEATTAGGGNVAFAFDAETKLLVHRSSSYTDVTFEDYRKVGGIQFPYKQTRSPILSIQLNEIKINEKIDESIFSARENCFDKPN